MVDTAKVDLLLVPTGKSLEKDPPLPPDSNNVDHYKCYGITVAKAPKGGEPLPKFTPFDVKLEDQFGPMTVTVTKPTLLCNPVKKERDGEGAEEIKNPANHLVCYQITRSKAVPSQSPFKRIRVFLRNQFGPEVLDARAMGGLCAPSLKDPLP
ncbi:MAG: hypothetical protein HYS70_01000 [Nitrospinae bacterium]|nr:hypothetical protein [Nitrospinota bacterium]